MSMAAPHVPRFPAWVDEDRATERLFREAEQGIAVYRLQCAAITRGCTASIAFEGELNVDVDHLDPLAWADRRAARLLSLNGWRTDHGRWICGAHDGSADRDKPYRAETGAAGCSNPFPMEDAPLPDAPYQAES